MSDNSCGCTCTPDPQAVNEMVRSALYDEISAGRIQAPLRNTEGTYLGAATVMTADEVRGFVAQATSGFSADIKAANNTIDGLRDDVKDLQTNKLSQVITDDSLTGAGTPSSKLGVAIDWLKNRLGTIFQVDGAVVASRVTKDGNISSTIIGDTGYTMGGPMGFIPIPGQENVGIPLYATRRQ